MHVSEGLFLRNHNKAATDARCVITKHEVEVDGADCSELLSSLFFSLVTTGQLQL